MPCLLPPLCRPPIPREYTHGPTDRGAPHECNCGDAPREPRGDDGAAGADEHARTTEKRPRTRARILTTADRRDHLAVRQVRHDVAAADFPRPAYARRHGLSTTSRASFRGSRPRTTWGSISRRRNAVRRAVTRVTWRTTSSRKARATSCRSAIQKTRWCPRTGSWRAGGSSRVAFRSRRSRAKRSCAAARAATIGITSRRGGRTATTTTCCCCATSR